MRSAFYITVDDRYLGIGQAQARRLHALWGIDVHVFVEGEGGKFRDENGRDGVFLHRNLMDDLIPQGLPATESWPRIVYGRIFAPYLLPQYDRLIYLDADIFPMVRADELLGLALPGGLAAVQDAASIGSAPRSAGGLDRAAWLRSIGVQGARYFNAGVMMLDRQAWASVDFGAELLAFMTRYGDAAHTQDQDFLNCYFQGRWTEISPRFNFQKAHFNYGYEQVFPPVFLHFSSFEKPWLQEAAPDTVHGQFFRPYQQMMGAAGVDYRQYLRPRRQSVMRRLRGGMRKWLTQRGIRTGKERRQWQEWRQKSDALYQGFRDDAAAGRYRDMDFLLDRRPEPELSFDGSYLRRSLDVSFDPVQ
ncbi:glycosyltransferase family 8 protein [Paracoccus aerodenitrificans]|uniref:glycosyltransferase family 8 protein n=1 Tax=Paracoccus aerodenitrificans TaxID=3017781 RepID=UPI0022F00670|nr:glycosyltransferase [Paracoccus aerodenitrificans]WBU64213.1 hypothetical protein PAE61_01795 [Paracoccus aerodenitrificans]